jgi:hypothetical protein
MIRTRAGSPENRWGLRDAAAAAVLFLATAGVILWQNAHVAVLFDLSYILNTAERIALGQTFPWRTRRSRFLCRPRSSASPAGSSFTMCSM